MREVVKIQRSIASSDERESCMVYNEDRSAMMICPLTAELRALFADDVFKIYAVADFNPDPEARELHVVEVIDDQPW